MFPEAAEAEPAAAAAREYVRTIFSNVTSAEAAQQKRKDKGKNITFDPKKAKKLTIFVASDFPSWQEKYIELVRELFDATHLSVDDKALNQRMAQIGEMKKPMPFVQGMKRRLMAGESPTTVFERKLLFDELQTLEEMAPGLKKIAGCKSVDIIAVDEGGKSGHVVLSDERSRGEPSGIDLPPTAQGAVPGLPTFFLQNIDV